MRDITTKNKKIPLGYIASNLWSHTIDFQVAPPSDITVKPRLKRTETSSKYRA